MTNLCFKLIFFVTARSFPFRITFQSDSYEAAAAAGDAGKGSCICIVFQHMVITDYMDLNVL